MAKCNTCGNNTCNGSYGRDAEGAWCKDCPSAYDFAAKIEQGELLKKFDSWIDEKYPVNQESNSPAADQIKEMTEGGVDATAMLVWLKEGGSPPWEK